MICPQLLHISDNMDIIADQIVERHYDSGWLETLSE